ncbi:MAG: hypothetical protein JNG90_07775 [Planctomycetaceae bacterium]|nr:hypothetical protein [Planctomycetaceae bacterium]
MSLIRHIYLAYFSQPKSERVLYRLIRRHKIHRIVELGLGTGLRATRLIRAAQGATPGATIRYTGIDLFEARPDQSGPGLALKEAYRLLKTTGVQPQLVPGDPFSALARVANGLQGTELVLISADQDPAALAQAWFYLPRLLTPQSLIFSEAAEGPPGRRTLKQLTRLEVERLASAGERRRAA